MKKTLFTSAIAALITLTGSIAPVHGSLFIPPDREPEDIAAEAAIEKIDDQSTLAEIAKNDKNAWMRWWAVEKLENQAAIAEIAKNNEDPITRGAAVDKLDDQALLAEIAKNDADGDVRALAALKLNDQALIAEIAKNDASKLVRGVASNRLERLNSTERRTQQNIEPAATTNRLTVAPDGLSISLSLGVHRPDTHTNAPAKNAQP